MALYKKKPITLEAIQFVDFQTSLDACIEFLGENVNMYVKNDRIVIVTLEGDLTVSNGDYIVRGIAGEFYPVKPELFAKLYDYVQGT